MLLEPIRISLRDWAFTKEGKHTIPKRASITTETIIDLLSNPRTIKTYVQFFNSMSREDPTPADSFLVCRLASLQRAKNFFSGDGQVHDPHAHRVIDSVGDGRGHLGDRAFADFFALKWSCPILSVHERGFQRHQIFYVRDLVFAQIGRHDSAVFHDHLFHQGVAHALHNAAIDLPLEPHWIQNCRHVMHGVQPAQVDLTGLDVDLDFRNTSG